MKGAIKTNIFAPVQKPVIAIFASGNGSNAEKIIEHFRHKEISVGLVLTNNPKAKVLEVAQSNNIPGVLFTRDEFYTTSNILTTLKQHNISHIVLAGFLWLIPDYLLRAYPGRMINIHPALLPKFGGKGMYGNHVHRAVKESNEKETGITIHLVDANYDEGAVIRYEKVDLNGTETVEEIALKVQQLEHSFFPETIEKWIFSNS